MQTRREILIGAAAIPAISAAPAIPTANGPSQDGLAARQSQLNGPVPLDVLNALYAADVPGGVAMPYIAKFGQEVNILDFLPLASWIAGNYTVVVDTPGIGDNVSEWMSGGGGGSVGNKVNSGRTLNWPAREIVWTEQGNWNGVLGVMPGSAGLGVRFAKNWSIVGQGSVSRMTVLPGSGLACLGISDCDHWSVRDILLDGKFPTHGASGWHTPRVGGECDDWKLIRVYCLDSPGYGFGFQANNTSDSIFTNGLIDGCIVKGAANDAVDFKNAFLANKNITVTNSVFWNWRRNGVTGECAGLDCRQPTLCSNLWFIQEDLGGGVRSVDSSALRFRHGAGTEGQQSIATNIHVFMTTHPDNITSDVPNIGIDMEAPDCHVGGAFLHNCDRGLLMGANERNTVDNVNYDGCNIAIAGLDPKALISNNIARNSAVKDTQFTTGVRTNNCRWESAGETIKEVIFGEQGSVGFNGLERTAEGEFTLWNNGVSGTKFLADGTMLRTLPPVFASNAAAAAGGVPVGGEFLIGSALNIRVP